MKTLLLTFIFLSFNGFAQQKYLTKTGTINFEASVPSFEEVAAKNNSATAILNTDNGEFATLALVKAFRFKNALMEEHFNENYAESSTYPKATFKGTLDNFSLDDLNSTEKIFKLNGELSFHGVTKPIKNCKVALSLNENTINFSGTLKVLASDFNIEIPGIVKNKIAEDIELTFKFKLQRQ